MTMFEDKYVIIIEDNATDVNVLQSLLKRLGVNFVALADGRNVIDRLIGLPVPDAIFLDLELPGITGYEVFDALKTVRDLAKVPVIAYTSHLSEMSAARSAGFHSFLSKPLNPTEFSEQVADIFDGISVWVGR
jgi:CheY-like chemotaxis protein